MTAHSASRTLFFFEKPSAMRQLQRFFKSPSTICDSAEGHLLAAEEPGSVRDEWKSWRFDTLPIVLERIPVTYGTSRSGQSHKPKVEAIKQALQGVKRVIIATDPGREGSMIAWEVLEHLGYRGRVDRLKLGALDEVSIRRAFAAMAKEPDSGERDYAAFVGFLAAALAVSGALVDNVFDAAALRAGAFFVVVLVAVFATGENLPIRLNLAAT